MNYTAIDFETANCERTSICAVGLVRVENGEVVKKAYSLVNPCAPFDYRNVRIHGITPRDVARSPTFAALWPSISRFFADNVVAHNAPFDVSCLKAASAMYGIEMPPFDYFCTLSISRRALSLPSNRLDCVARHFNLPPFAHHNALADAMACALIFGRFGEELDLEPFRRKLGAPPPAPRPRADFSEPFGGRRKYFETLPEAARKSLFAASLLAGAAPRAKNSAPEFDNPAVDFSKTFKIAGRFAGDMTLKQAESLIIRAGGRVANSMDEFPDYLVMGGMRDVRAAPGEFCEEYYVAKKSGIPVLSEKYFLSLIVD